MKKSKRKRPSKRTHQAASGRPGEPTAKRLKHVAEDVMAQNVEIAVRSIDKPNGRPSPGARYKR